MILTFAWYFLYLLTVNCFLLLCEHSTHFHTSCLIPFFYGLMSSLEHFHPHSREQIANNLYFNHQLSYPIVLHNCKGNLVYALPCVNVGGVLKAPGFHLWSTQTEPIFPCFVFGRKDPVSDAGLEAENWCSWLNRCLQRVAVSSTDLNRHRESQGNQPLSI